METTAEDSTENIPVPSSNEEKSNNDILAARREARRRRILENSNKRLTKITGREHNEPPLVPESETTISPNVIYPDPEMERDSFDPDEISRHGAFPLQPEPDVLEMLREFRTQAGMSPSGMMSGQQEQQPMKPPSKMSQFLRTKVHYMLMGVIVSLLYVTENEWMIGNSVFLPLFCWEAIEVFLLKTYETKLNFLGIIFMFFGVDQRYVQIITKILETLNKIFKDFACFMWFFVVTHLVWGYFVDQKAWNEILYPKGRDEGAPCPNV